MLFEGFRTLKTVTETQTETDSSAVSRVRDRASRCGARRHGPETHESGDRGRRLPERTGDGVLRPQVPGTADVRLRRPPAAMSKPFFEEAVLMMELPKRHMI